MVSVHDGDSLRVKTANGTERIRLSGIDAPELEQPLGLQARSMTERLTLGQKVVLHEQGCDRYGRTVAEVINAHGVNVNQALVKTGMAWWYQDFAPHDRVLERLQGAAQRKHLGVWADTHSIAPWHYRKLTASEAPYLFRHHKDTERSSLQTAERDFSMR